MSLELIDENPDAGFNYPYYLAVPDSLEGSNPTPILVEPPNMPGPTDDFEAHLVEAERRARCGFGRRIAKELTVPFVHPVFPRPVSDPVDWTHHIHQLDLETIRIDDSPLERVDLQLLSMVQDAQARLSELGVPVREQFCMNGFSASGSFVNRFTALHPEALLSVSAGGINGMAILPIEEAEVSVEWIDSRSLNYPVGISNMDVLIGKPFDLEAFRSVNQLLFLGEDDDNDTLLYPDAWTGPEIRATAILVYGEDIHKERFPYCESVYEEVNAAAMFREYPNTGHDPGPALEDIVEFHKQSINGEDIEAIRTNLEMTASK